MSSPAFRMSLLGTPRITRTRDGEPIDVPLGKPFAALAYVALATERVTRDDLVHLLWPSTMGGRGRASVRQALWLLRKQIHPDVVVEADGVLSVNPEVLRHDLSDLGTQIAEGHLEEAWRGWRGVRSAGWPCPTPQVGMPGPTSSGLVGNGGSARLWKQRPTWPRGRSA